MTTASMPFSFLPQTPHLFLGRVHGRLVVFLKDNQNNESDMDLEEVMAQKKKNLEMLIRNKDEAIRKEMLQYEEAELYIRLQSECFNLYPVVIEGVPSSAPS